MARTRQSPRLRRLRNDYKSLQHLQSDSSILTFDSQGHPPEYYTLRFLGRGLWRPDGANDVLIREQHEVSIKLGASYPRMMPELLWKTPIFHPNISASGVVCLGGYGTYWTPGLNLDELCTMLWDMIRYDNFDVESPYNREAAHWAKTQSTYRLPLDRRSIRDRVSGERAPFNKNKPPIKTTPTQLPPEERFTLPDLETEAAREVVFLDDGDVTTPAPHTDTHARPHSPEVIDAVVIEPENPEILFID